MAIPITPKPAAPPQLEMAPEQYRRLAEFRYQMRRFLHFSQEAAAASGLHPRQYQLLQVIAGIPEEMSPTIAAVASRLCLRHNSAVELVSRTIEQGLLRKAPPDPIDNRRLLLQITAAGHRLLGSLTEFHLRELDESGPELIRALKRVLAMRQDDAPLPAAQDIDTQPATHQPSAEPAPRPALVRRQATGK